MTLSMGEKIRILARRKKVTIAMLADKLETSRQNFTNKLNRDNFSEKELHEIAKILESRYEGFFILDDNEMI